MHLGVGGAAARAASAAVIWLLYMCACLCTWRHMCIVLSLDCMFIRPSGRRALPGSKVQGGTCRVHPVRHDVRKWMQGLTCHSPGDVHAV